MSRITGAAAKKVKPHQHDSELKGYMALDEVQYRLPGGIERQAELRVGVVKRLEAVPGHRRIGVSGRDRGG